MKVLLRRLCLPLVAALTTSLASAETTATPPAGFFKLTARAASDSFLSIPLVRESALLGSVTAVEANTVTLAIATAPVDGAYAPHSGAVFHAQFVSGDLEGLCYLITGNNGGTFTLDTQGDDLTRHPLGSVAAGGAGDLVRIRPCWTIAEVFGRTADELLLAPVSDVEGTIYKAGDAVLLPDRITSGTEKRPAAVVAFVAGEGWRQQGAPAGGAGAFPLLPGYAFVVRHQAPSPVEALVVGYVPQERAVLRLPALAAGEETDVSVALVQPGSKSLADSGLQTVLTESSDALAPADELLEFSDDRHGFALPAAHRLLLADGVWLETDAPAGDRLLRPATGYILRLRGGRAVRYWIQTRPY